MSRNRGFARPAWPLVWLLCALVACSSPTPPLAPLAPDAVLLAFGDSLTYGSGAARDESYPAVLEALSGRKVANAGIPGEVSAQGRERLAAALDRWGPAVLILCHGGNDMLRRIDARTTTDNLRAMIELARARGVAVVLLGVPQPTLLARRPPPFYDELAREFALPYDGATLSDIESDESLKSDAIHPNAAGYRRLAEAVHALLTDAGAL